MPPDRSHCAAAGAREIRHRGRC